MTNTMDSGKLIRNVVIALDFILMWGVLLIFSHIKDGTMVHHVLSLFAIGTLSLSLSEIAFSTVVHLHYHNIDKVLRQVTFLSASFGLYLIAFCYLHKVIIGEICNVNGIIGVVVCLYALLITSRFIEYFVIKLERSQGKNSRKVIFVGDAENIMSLVMELDGNVTGLKFGGYYSAAKDETLTEKIPYLGDYDDLQKAMDKQTKLADDIYCSLSSKENKLIIKMMDYCMSQATRFFFMPLFLKEFGQYMSPQLVGNQVVFSNFSEPLLKLSNRFVKRAFDLIVSGVVLVCLIPFVPIVALIIKIQSPGPVFFKQLRTGLGGKNFYCYKFRSMHVNDDADKVQATKDDPRKFAFGDFMRKANIDELPQFLNVFLGDMSIVGPRPHMLAHTEEYRHKIVDYMVRHYVRPGITGWAQTTGFRGETKELWQMEGRVKRDIWYIQNWSFWLDMRIILKTAWQVVHHDENAW